MGIPSATKFLRDEHRRIRGLYQQLLSLDLREVGFEGSIGHELLMEIETHSWVEEQFFYPLFSDLYNQYPLEFENELKAPQWESWNQWRGWISESEDEHRQMHAAVDDLWQKDQSDSDLLTGLTALMELVEPHIEKEERWVLPFADQVIAKFLNQNEQLKFYQDLLRRKQELLASEKYRLSRPEFVQNPRGGEQMRRLKTG